MFTIIIIVSIVVLFVVILQLKAVHEMKNDESMKGGLVKKIPTIVDRLVNEGFELKKASNRTLNFVKIYNTENSFGIVITLNYQAGNQLQLILQFVKITDFKNIDSSDKFYSLDVPEQKLLDLIISDINLYVKGTYENHLFKSRQ